MTPVAGYRPYGTARAASYERLRGGQPEWARELAIITAAVDAIPSGSSLLDVPVGTGRFLELYAQHDLRVTGVDVSDAMLAVARRKQTTARLCLGSITDDLRLLVGGFVDYAVCLRLINWLTPSEAEQAFRRLMGVTRESIYVGLWAGQTAGMLAASAETQAEGEVCRWVEADGWRVVTQHVITAGETRTSAIWELRRADR